MLAFAIFSTVACNKNTGADQALLNGSWTMVKVSDEFTATTFTPPADMDDVIIHFNGDKHGGILSGVTSVNTIMPSPYTLAEV